MEVKNKKFLCTYAQRVSAENIFTHKWYKSEKAYVGHKY